MITPRLPCRLCRFWLLAIAALAMSVSAAEPQVELNGWRLLQFVKAMESAYGEPDKVVTDDGVTSRVYFIDRQAYMVAGATAAFPHHIATLQLTGISSRPLPFLGLSLGDPKDEVLAALGEPSSLARVDEWKLTRYDYDGRNYSVELDDNDRLYSIRIQADATVASDVADGESSPWIWFVDALASHDPARILDQLRPDIEIYRHGRTLDIGERFRDFADAPDADFMDALTGEHGVVGAAVGARPEERVRITEKMGVGLVYAFPAGSVLDEVVFFPYAGRYRVYEIAFRGAAEETGRQMLGRRSLDPSTTAMGNKPPAWTPGAGATLR